MGYIPPPIPMDEHEFYEAYSKLSDAEKAAIDDNPKLILKLDKALTDYKGIFPYHGRHA